MKNNPFTGVGTAIITPFRDGQVDFTALTFHVNRQIAMGIDFLVPCGTTGESPTLDHEEHNSVIEMTVALAKGRVPIMAGTGSNSTKEAVALTKGAKKAGADAVLVVSPYYNKPEPDGMLDYYRQVSYVGLPVYLYDIPGRTGRGVTTKVIIQLAEEGVIAGMKWASGNLEQAKEIIENVPSDFAMLSGDDANTLDLINIGGVGVISVTSNVAPSAMVNMVKFALTDEKEKAKKCFDILLPLMNGLFVESNPQPVKTAMALLYPEIFLEAFRSPMTPMRIGNRQQLQELLAQYNEDDH